MAMDCGGVTLHVMIQEGVILMLADLIRAFCNENNYQVYENYKRHSSTEFGESDVTTLGIVVKSDRNMFDVLAQLNSYIEAKQFDDSIMAELCEELEATNWAPLEQDDIIIYFPYIHNYPPQ